MRFVARRLAFVMLLVVVASTGAMLLARLAPGDATAELFGRATAEEIAATRARFDLDRGPLAQWWLWATRAARFDFGTSYLYNQPVAPLVARAAANTAGLGLTALVLATLAGLSLGIVTGSRRGWLPAVIRAGSLLCVSLPPLLTSLLFVFLAAKTGWFHIGGMTSVDAVDQDWAAWIVDVAQHLPLPALALALPIAAAFERLQAQAMRDAIGQPFVMASVARGAPREVVLRRHAWRASLPAICAVYGLAIGGVLSGSFVVEVVTTWPGLGRLMIAALLARDVYLVAGCAAAGAVFVGFGLFVGDVLLAAVDPRVREDAA
jgi:peptide/nickel transport system permease protein